ncbi:MAG: type II secretion system protein [Candidatus Moranbacteria bacterium]|nr:type II secretion system protein [Candidatus Moranbacteria bacterium]
MPQKKFGKNSGMTLIELLIAMFIFILIMSSSVFLLSQIYKRYGFAMEQGMSTNAVRHSLKIILEEMRGVRQSDAGSYPIDQADDFSFTAYTDLDHDGQTERVHYYLEGNTIKKGIADPSGTPPSYPAGDETVSIIAEHVVNTTIQPLFYFYNTNYPADQENNPLGTPISPVSDIRLVKIDIYYNLDPNRSPDNVRLESFVELRNLKDNW